MKPTILVAAQLSERLLLRLSERYTVCGPIDNPEPHTLPAAARDARALITIGGCRTDDALMQALPSLGLIACYGTGYEGVDRVAAPDASHVI